MRGFEGRSIMPGEDEWDPENPEELVEKLEKDMGAEKAEIESDARGKAQETVHQEKVEVGRRESPASYDPLEAAAEMKRRLLEGSGHREYSRKAMQESLETDERKLEAAKEAGSLEERRARAEKLAEFFELGTIYNHDVGKALTYLDGLSRARADDYKDFDVHQRETKGDYSESSFKRSNRILPEFSRIIASAAFHLDQWRHYLVMASRDREVFDSVSDESRSLAALEGAAKEREEQIRLLQSRMWEATY